MPERGDLAWMNFSPQAGSEQAGRRPAVILTARAYNQRIGLLLACPITSRIKGYPFEVPLDPGLPIAGVILADQVRTIDFRARRAEFIARLSKATCDHVRMLARKLLD